MRLPIGKEIEGLETSRGSSQVLEASTVGRAVIDANEQSWDKEFTGFETVKCLLRLGEP